MNPAWWPRPLAPWVIFDCTYATGRCAVCGGYARRFVSPEQVRAFHARHYACIEQPRPEQGEHLVTAFSAAHGEALGSALYGHRPFAPASRAVLAVHENDALFDAYCAPRGAAWFLRYVDRAGMPRILDAMGRRGEARAFAALCTYSAGVNGPDDGLLLIFCEDGHRVGAVLGWPEVDRWETEARAARTLRTHLQRRPPTRSAN